MSGGEPAAAGAHGGGEPAAAGARGDGGQPVATEPWRRPRPFRRPVWYPLVGASAVLALLAGGGMTLLTLSGGPAARPLADSCGLVTCHASLPPAVTGAVAPSTAARSTAPAPRRRHGPRPPALAPAPHLRAHPVAPQPLPHRRPARRWRWVPPWPCRCPAGYAPALRAGAPSAGPPAGRNRLSRARPARGPRTPCCDRWSWPR